MPSVKFHPKKIAPLVEDIMKAANSRNGIFSVYHSENTPEKQLLHLTDDKKVTTIIMFDFCSINRQSNSHDIAKNVQNAFSQKPELFDPKNVRETYTSVTDIKPVIKEYFSHMPNETSKAWFRNATMLETYDDDPRNIIKWSKDEEEINKNVDAFYGFGVKQVPLFLYWCKRDKLCDGYGEEKFKIPMDRHVLKISLQAGICEVEGEIRRERVSEPLTKLYDAYFAKHPEYDKFLFQEYMWIHGSHACHYRKCNDGCARREKCTVTVDDYLFDEHSIVKQIDMENM